MSEWYYAQGEQRLGPVPEDELGRMLQTGQLPFNTLVWQPGMLDWKAANEVPALFSAAPAMPGTGDSPIPPVPPEFAFAGYAGFWKRFAALIIDIIIVFVGGMMALMFFIFLLAASGLPQDAMERITNLLGAAIAWLYWAGFESSSWQATLGKRAVGIIVVDAQGHPISFLRATGRHFAKYISGLILLIGYFMAAFTPQKQALHDLIASCLVINRP